MRIEGDDLEPTRFVVMAGLGLDAAIMDGAPDALKAKIGWTAYVVAGAKHLRYPAVRVDISVDGGEPVRRRARTVVIGNVGNLQAGIPLLARRGDRRRRARRRGDRAAALLRLGAAGCRGS